MEIDIKIPELKPMQAAFAKAPAVATAEINRALEQATAAVTALAHAEAPVRTGRLRASIINKVEDLRGIIFTPVRYAIYVEAGTQPHTIVPTTKKALYWKGADHPVRIVRHPGTRPNPFMRRAATKGTPLVRAAFKTATMNIIATLKV